MKNLFSKENRLRRKLLKIDPDDVPSIPYRGETIPCVVPEVYDGDTLTAIYMIKKVPIKIRVRLFGIDAPELRGKGVSKLESEVGKLVGEFVRSWIHKYSKILYIKIQRFDKYGGRFIGDIFARENGIDVSLATMLLQKNFVVPYQGQKKIKWTEVKLKKLRKLIIQELNENEY